jgi:YgiT-type zinc finger domain-containing protein
MKEPTCCLCSGPLTIEKSVKTGWIKPGGGEIVLPLAWVCTHCSTAFPMAVGKTDFWGSNPQPLWADGMRITEAEK